MEILLIRHGEAVEAAPGLGDAGRWLTGKGRRVTREVAAWLSARDKRRPRELWTSPLVRAVQTAEIVAQAAGLESEVSVAPELASGADPGELLRLVTAYRGDGPLGLVGHEPSLSLLARGLLGQVAWPGLKKSGIAAISLENAEDGRVTAHFRYLLVPKGMQRIRTLEAEPEQVIETAAEG